MVVSRKPATLAIPPRLLICVSVLSGCCNAAFDRRSRPESERLGGKSLNDRQLRDQLKLRYDLSETLAHHC